MTLDLQPGANFGDYVLEQRLGAGGFGAVWLSHDAAGNKVAVKVLNGQYPSDEMAKLHAEIELLAAAASSRSRHIVRVLGGGAQPAPYVVMEYIEGTDLSREIAQRGAIPVPEVLVIADAIADALSTLQRAGIIHRDIKPGNVMIDPQGVVKLTDFGIAKIVGIDTVSVSSQMSLSTPYAAPEVWDGKANHLSDHYAYGVLLYQALTGKVPFAGNYAEMYRQHLSAEPDLSTLPPETPPSLRALIKGCLEKDQSLRPQNAQALVSAVATAKAEYDRQQETGQLPLQDPKQIGPWVIDSRVPDDPWVFNCHHETTGEAGIVEIQFSDDLAAGEALRKQYPGRASRLILRPGEGWADAPESELMFWFARTEGETLASASAVEDSPTIVTSSQSVVNPAASQPVAAAPLAAAAAPIAAAPLAASAASSSSTPPPASPPPTASGSGGGGAVPPSKAPPSDPQRQPTPMLIVGVVVAAAVVVGGLFALGVFGGKKNTSNPAVKAAQIQATAIAGAVSTSSAAGAAPTASRPSTTVVPTTAPSGGGAAAPTATPAGYVPTPAPSTAGAGSIAVDGAAVNGSTTAAGQNLRYTFTGKSGQVVSVLASKVSKPLVSACAYLSVLDAQAKALGKTLICSENGFLDQVTLGAAGTYTVAWDPSDNAFGTATFNLYNVVDNTGPIAIDGAAVSFNTSTPGQNGVYTFNGTANQVVSVLASKVSKPLASACAYISILDNLNTSQGKTLICTDPGFLDQVELPKTGAYTLMFDPQDISTGQATLNLYNVVDVTGTLSIDGPSVAASTSTPGQNAKYTFTGKSGQVVTVQATAVSKPLATACAYLSIVDSIGTSLGKNLICGDGTLDKVALPKDGSYTLIMDPQDISSGQVTLALTTKP